MMRPLIAVGAVIVSIFAGAPLSRAADGPEGCYYEPKRVKSLVELPLGMPEGVTFLEKDVYRGGDRIALGIVHAFTEAELADTSRAARIITIVRLAFSQPKYITRDEDKDPAVTMLLLSFLENREGDPSLKQSIRDAEDYVSKQTGAGAVAR